MRISDWSSDVCSSDLLRKTTFNIHELCERVYRLVGAEFPHIEFVRDYDASVPDVNGDLERLLQALLNIVRNAAQALTETPPKGSARLVLRTRIGRQLLLATQQAKLGVEIGSASVRESVCQYV